MRKFQIGEVVGGVEIGTARYNWGRMVSDVVNETRLYGVGSRAPIRYETAILRAGFSEIISLRLQLACAPIFNTLQNIERKVGAIADLRREPWAPADHPVNL